MLCHLLRGRHRSTRRRRVRSRPVAVVTVEYTPIDFQLLFELRLAIEEERALPLPMLRVLDARGWLVRPISDECVEVQTISAEDGTPYPRASYVVGEIELTPLGERELALFKKQLDYGEMLAILAEDEEGVDADDPDDEDGE